MLPFDDCSVFSSHCRQIRGIQMFNKYIASWFLLKNMICVLGNWLSYTFGESGVAVVAAPVQDKIDKLKG